MSLVVACSTYVSRLIYTRHVAPSVCISGCNCHTAVILALILTRQPPGEAQIPLGHHVTSRHDTCQVRRGERAEPCCWKSSTDSKCMGSTRRTCRVVSRRDMTSQVESGLEQKLLSATRSWTNYTTYDHDRKPSNREGDDDIMEHAHRYCVFLPLKPHYVTQTRPPACLVRGHNHYAHLRALASRLDMQRFARFIDDGAMDGAKVLESRTVLCDWSTCHQSADSAYVSDE